MDPVHDLWIHEGIIYGATAPLHGLKVIPNYTLLEVQMNGKRICDLVNLGASSPHWNYMETNNFDWRGDAEEHHYMYNNCVTKGTDCPFRFISPTKLINPKEFPVRCSCKPQKRYRTYTGKKRGERHV